MKRRMRITSRHKWVYGCTISESYDIEDEAYRRFTATIDGWRNFKIYEGYLIDSNLISAVILRVKSVQQRIKVGDDSVFREDVSIFSVV